MGKKPISLTVGDYQTLPCRYLHGRVVGNVEAYRPDVPFRAEYVEPTYVEYAYELNRECLHRASTDVEYAIAVLSDWSSHIYELGYFLQFYDDPGGIKIKRLHSHTQLAAAILTERLKMDDQLLLDSFHWMVTFRWLQQQYRADPKRKDRYQVHAENLDRKAKKQSTGVEAAVVIDKAVKYMNLQRAEWPKLPPILNISLPAAKVGKLVSLFYSYSHEDEGLRVELEKHLQILQNDKQIDQWHDRCIGAGQECKDEIDEHLKTADLILLLISSDFIASRYCWGIEMEEALKRHRAGQAVVIPIFLRPCVWDEAPFAQIQGLPKDAKPVTTWDNRDEAFVDIVKGIRCAVTDIRLKWSQRAQGGLSVRSASGSSGG